MSLIHGDDYILELNEDVLKAQTTTTDKNVLSEQYTQPRVTSQRSGRTNMPSGSSCFSAVKRYCSKSSKPRCSKLSAFARFMKFLGKKKTGDFVKGEPTRECVSCMDDFPACEMVHVKCHGYCKECFERLVCTAMDSETLWPVKCCITVIRHADIVKNINENLVKQFLLKVDERKIPAGYRVYCIKPSCATWIPPKRINKGLTCASCPSCRTKVCTICRGLWHGKMEGCPKDEDLRATVDLAREKGWKACPACNALVELTAGCRHMVCLCKAHWCYRCQTKWKACKCAERNPSGLRNFFQRRRTLAQRTPQQTPQPYMQQLMAAERCRILIQRTPPEITS